MDQNCRKTLLKSPDQNNIPDEIDPFNLYVRQIPLNINEDEFLSIMSGDGRRQVTRIMLNKKVLYSHTIGFAEFASHEEALDALEELNGNPPLFLNICFAKKKNQNFDKSNLGHTDNQQSFCKGKGRGVLISPIEPQYNVDNIGNFGMRSKGRGLRISLDGPINASQKIKVITGDHGGRKVTMESPPKAAVPLVNQQFLNARSPPRRIENHCPPQPQVHSEKNLSRKTDAATSLMPNPFYFCFMCGQEGTLSCRNCKKPYCSRNCQAEDSVNHQEMCKKSKEVADILLCFFKNSFPQSNDSSYMSENSNSENEIAPIRLNKVNVEEENKPLSSTVLSPGQVEMENKPLSSIVLSPGQVEMVFVINVESPSMFWISLKKFSSELAKIEEELTVLRNDLQAFRVSSCVPPKLYCCAPYQGKLCRVEVLQVKSQKEILVFLCDYGKTVTVQRSTLYALPPKFRKLPIQAVPCQLFGDAKSCSIEWNSEDTLSFQLLTSNKTFKAHIFKCCDDVYDVSLINEDGITIYSLLAEEKEAIASITGKKEAAASITRKKESVSLADSSQFQPDEMDGSPPSIWSKMKPGSKMTLVPSIASEGFIWCYMFLSAELNGTELEEIEKLCANYSGEDITLSAEEEDFAVGFSVEFKQFYRCKILKRKRDGFLVHYIDYGNEEEIKCLKALSKELCQKYCYLVKCEKPSSLTIDDFLKLTSPSTEVTVFKVDKGTAELSFSFRGKQHATVCYPCYSDSGNTMSSVQASSAAIITRSPVSQSKIVPSNVKSPSGSMNSRSPSSQPQSNSSKLQTPSIAKNYCSPVSQPVITPRPALNYKASAAKITASKVLSQFSKYSVKVLFIKTVTELYVLKVDKEIEMNKMVENLNNVCNSSSSSHVPNVGEVVSCKFSDNVWYRGQVLEKLNNKYRIFFVDYGNEYIASQKDVQILPEKFSLPQFSICVSLSGIKNEDVSKSLLSKLLEEVWEMKVINAKKSPIDVMLFKDNVPLTKLIQNKVSLCKSNLNFQKLLPKATVKICFKDDNYLYVNQVKDLKPLEEMAAKLNSITDLPTPKNPKLTDVYSGLFVDDGLWYRVSIEEEVSSDKLKVYFLDYGNYEILSKSDLRELPNDLFSLPVYCIPITVQNINDITLDLEQEYTVEVIEVNENVQKVKFLSDSKNNSLLSTDNSDKKKSDLSFKMLPLEEVFEIKVCYQDDKYVYLHQIKDLPIVDDLFLKLNSMPDLPVVTKPVVNNVYCGLFSDGSWYRVSIEEISSGSSKVYFVDYGNYETISIDCLRELPRDFLSIPVCCVPVVVENRDQVAVSLEQQYNIKVVGMDGKVQKVKFMQLEQNNSSDVSFKSGTEKKQPELKIQKLPVEKSVDVKICHVDENYIYLHQVADLKVLEEMFVKLMSLSNLPSVKKPELNNVYCGLCSDGLWYRVSVKEISSSTCKVLFIDYGNFETISCEGLREISSDLLEIPVLAVPVIAKNRQELVVNLEEQYSVEVTGMKNEHQEVKFLLSKKGDVELPQISTFSKQKLGEGLHDVIFCFKDHEVVYCQLSSDSDRVLSMFKILQRCGREGKAPKSLSVGDVVCAQCSDTLWYRACILSDQKAPSYEVLFFDYGNSESIIKDCIKVLPHELLDMPIFALRMKIENMDKIKDSSIYTEPVTVRKIKEVNNDTYVVQIQIDEDNSLKISALKRLTLPNDCVSNVTVCHIDDSLYYIQPTSNLDNLVKFSRKLSEAETFSNLPHIAKEDDVICAKFTDGVWYRCVVQEVLSDKIKVCFIDFGNSDLVSNENVKVLPSELADYPVACIPVKFKDETTVQNKICEGISTFDVKVISEDDNIQVVDIAVDTNLVHELSSESVVPVSIKPMYVSEFEKSFLLLNECDKVIFKAFVDNRYVVNKSAEVSEMEKLSLLLQESKIKMIHHLPSINEVLVAKRNDNLWYRCSVAEISSEKDIFKVYFFDEGSTEEVQKCVIGHLPENCKNFPIFGIKVSAESEQTITLNKCYIIEVLNRNPDGIFCVKVYHQPIFSSIVRKDLVINKKTDVIFFHKEREKLFLQDIADLEMIAQVQSMLLKCSSGTSILYMPKVGELVCAMSQLDNSWYRGCIEEVVSANKYKVFFIDYGNCEEVPKEHLQPIPHSLTKFPSFCIPVKFADKEVAKSIELEKVYCVIAQSEVSNNVQIIKLDGTDSEESCKKTESVESSLLTTSSNNKISKKFDITSCKSVPFNPGEQDIVIYSVDEEGILFCAPYDLKNIEANLKLPASLTSYCQEKGLPFDDREPEVGEIVMALFSEDNNWYRAAVIEKSHPMYDVNFVDFGNTERINVSSLKKMEEQFMELDIQAHMCSLTGFSVLSEGNLPKIREELNKYIIFSNSEPLRAHVSIIDDDITVNIPEITSELVKKNLVAAAKK